MLFDLLLKGTSVAILIDEVVVVGCFQDLDEPDHVGCVFDLGEGLDFIYSELLELRAYFEFLDLDDLDGHCLVGLFVDGLVDLSELALADYVVEHVVLYLLAHLTVRLYQ